MALMSVEFKLSLLQLTIDFIKKKKKSKCDKICSQLKLNVLFSIFEADFFLFTSHGKMFNCCCWGDALVTRHLTRM